MHARIVPRTGPLGATVGPDPGRSRRPDAFWRIHSHLDVVSSIQVHRIRCDPGVERFNLWMSIMPLVHGVTCLRRGQPRREGRRREFARRQLDYLASTTNATVTTTTRTTAEQSSMCPMGRRRLTSALRTAASAVFIEPSFGRVRSRDRNRAVAVAATQPMVAVAKGRNNRKSIATLEKASVTPPATPAPGSRWSSVDRHDRDRRDKEHDQSCADSRQPGGTSTHHSALAAPRSAHPHDQRHSDQQRRAGPRAS